MDPAQYACNDAMLRFLPYPETGKFVNVGVPVTCQPCMRHFVAERAMPERAKSLFPKQNAQVFEASLEALRQEMERVKAGASDPKSVQLAFQESLRIRESVFRVGAVRTVLTATPGNLAEEFFARDIRMESPVLQVAPTATV